MVNYTSYGYLQKKTSSSITCPPFMSRLKSSNGGWFAFGCHSSSSHQALNDTQTSPFVLRANLKKAWAKYSQTWKCLFNIFHIFLIVPIWGTNVLVTLHYSKAKFISLVQMWWTQSNECLSNFTFKKVSLYKWFF